MFDLLHLKERANNERREQIINSFSVRRIHGCDYILHNGTVVSREKDDDILERLQELRNMALSQAGLND